MYNSYACSQKTGDSSEETDQIINSKKKISTDDSETESSTAKKRARLSQYHQALYKDHDTTKILQHQHDETFGKESAISKLLRKTKTLHQGPNPPWYCTNSFLQLFPFMFQTFFHRVRKEYHIPFQHFEHPTGDGGDVIRVSVYPKFESNSRKREDLSKDVTKSPKSQHEGGVADDQHVNIKELPLVVILGGVRAVEQDMPGTTLVRRLVATKRFRTAFITRRGHMLRKFGTIMSNFQKMRYCK